MIRVTKAEVKEALGEIEMTKEYCICRNCHYAFRITDEERKEYQDLRCGNCSSIAFYYAGYDAEGVDSIIDPEPTQPQEQYVVGTLHVGNHIYTFEEANLKADEAVYSV
jgi:DNA-directed RNA polymerase subunit RPC12/RpoP